MNKESRKKWTFEAGSVDEAVAIALKDLGVSREQIDVVVVSEEKRGLFGMSGAEPAKIVVQLRA